MLNYSMNKQITLSAFNDALAKVRAKKEEFLAQMDRIIPWGERKARIQPYCCLSPFLCFRTNHENKPHTTQYVV